MSDVGLPASPLAVTPTGWILFYIHIMVLTVSLLTWTLKSFNGSFSGIGNVLADPHFTRDTHMRIILGNSSAGVGRNVKSGADLNHGR